MKYESVQFFVLQMEKAKLRGFKETTAQHLHPHEYQSQDHPQDLGSRTSSL